MAMSVKRGTFTKSTAAAPTTQDITDVGFQPKALRLWTTNQTAAGLATGQIMCVGMTDGTTELSQCFASDDAVATTNVGTITSNTKVLTIISNGTPTTVVAADHSAFLANGFRLSYTTNDANATLIHYEAWGGADLTNVKAIEYVLGTGTGNVAYTGVGFQGEFGIFDVGSSSAGVPQSLSFGVAVSSSKRWFSAFAADDAATMTGTMDMSRYQRTDSVITAVLGFVDSGRADFVSWGADGFTLNHIVAFFTGVSTLHALIFKGGSYDVGAVSKCTTGSCVDTVTPTATPKLVLLASWALAASTTITADANASWGSFDATSEGSVWSNTEDATLNTVADRQYLTTKALSWDDQVGASPTISDEADGAISGATFTLTWTTNSGAAQQWLWASFGDAVVVPSTDWIPPTNQPYREQPQIVTY